MTTPQAAAEREAFVAWRIERGESQDQLSWTGRMFAIPRVQGMWLAWQAALRTPAATTAGVERRRHSFDYRKEMFPNKDWDERRKAIPIPAAARNAPTLTSAELVAIRRATEVLETLDYNESAGKLRAILDCRLTSQERK